MHGVGVFLMLWITFWSAITLSFDLMIVRRVVAQVAASGYASVQGRVLESRVDEQRGEDASYQPHVLYSYEINGRKYESSVYSFHEIKSSDASWARAVVAAHPPGGAVTVYVGADPGNALLAPGLAGIDLLFWLFLAPFNVVMVGGWVWARRTLWPPVLDVRELSHQTRVRLTPIEPGDGTAVAFLFIC